MSMQLRPYQQDAVNAVYDYLRKRDDNPCVVLPTGCHGYDHPILMFDGTLKPVQEIVVGDRIMGPDSRPRTVLQLCRGQDEMFRVSPYKGKPFLVNADHIMSLVCTTEGKHYPSARHGGEIDNISVRDYLGKSKSWQHLRKLYHVPVEFSSASDLPIPPYILGLLLGDGSFRDGITLTTADREVESAWCNYVRTLGCDVTVKDHGGRCPSYHINEASGTDNLLAKILKEMLLLGQLSGTKFIPQIYLTASQEDRMQLLAGILDADGHMAHGFFDYVTKSRELAADVVFLARSLGFMVHERMKYAQSQDGTGGWFFRINICGECSKIPCRLPRKQYPTRRQKKNVLRTGFSIESAGVGNYYGFTLDGDHLYLDGHFMVHHNSGKTPVIATICRDATTLWNGRVLILAHVKELLQQAADKLQMVCPDVPVGVYSAGLGSRDTRQSVIVAGIQSVYKKACELDRFDLILVDEAHLLPPDGEGMYQTFLNDAKIVNPNVRLIGLTATPYRLKSGTLVGPDTLLNSICYEIGVKQLIVQGFLSPLKTRASRHKTDYSNLHLRAGEFVSSEVEELIDNEDNVGPACREIIMQTRDRHSVLIFAISVSHAQHIKESIETLSGQECGLVTGDTPPAQRDLILRRFKGEHIQANLLGDDFPPLKYLVNVNVLTTGFDAPNVDCVVLLRPTASPGLYYQMVGRGFRLHETKSDCLILDFGNNIVRHGPVDAIVVKQAGERGGDGSPPAKECPECNAVIHAAYGICPDCGYVFPPPERDKHDSHASEEGILSGEIVDTDYDVMDAFYNVHAKKDAEEDAPKTMRVDYRVGFNDFKSEWVCPEHSGWARDKFEKWWKMRSNDPVPSTAQEAVDIADDGGLAPTTKITVRKVTGERFDRIIHYELGEKPPAMENREELDAFGDPVTTTTYYGTDDLDDDVPF